MHIQLPVARNDDGEKPTY